MLRLTQRIASSCGRGLEAASQGPSSALAGAAVASTRGYSSWGFAEDSTRSAAPLAPLAPGGTLPSLLPSGISSNPLWVPPEDAIEEGYQLMAVPKRKVTPHRKGLRSTGKHMKFNPGISRCPKCNSVKQAHWVCYKCTLSANPPSPVAPGGGGGE